MNKDNNYNNHCSSSDDDDSSDNKSDCSTCVLKDNDVLIGRGLPAVRHKGNIYFRKIVQDRMIDYIAAGTNHTVKTNIALSVIAQIHTNHGRFVYRRSTDKQLVIPITDENFVIEKSKQAFRDLAKKEKIRLSKKKTSNNKNHNNDSF